MKTPCLILGLLLLLSYAGKAQDEKGYKYYQKPDYKKAYDYCRSVLEENELEIMGNYVMSLLYSNSSFSYPGKPNVKFDYFKAFRYVHVAKAETDKLSDMKLEEYNKIIPDFKRTLNSRFTDIDEKLFNEIKSKQNNLILAESFISEFPDSRYCTDVIRIREKDEFEKVKGIDKVNDYDFFIERFPHALDHAEAIRLRDLAAYMNLNRNPVLDSAYDYIRRYPLSAQLDRVLDLRDSLEFISASTKNTKESFETYIKYFPNSKMTDKAIRGYIQKYYEKAQNGNQIKDYQDFIDRFNSADQAQAALSSRQNLQFQLVKDQNTEENYNKYLTWFPISKTNKDVINLRNKRALELARQSKPEIEALEDFIYKYPAAAEVQEARTIRDSLIFEQAKNSISVALFNEQLRLYVSLLDSKKANLLRAEIAFRELEKEEDKKAACELFFKLYPDSPLIPKVQEMMKRYK
jgi:hypothetical protein